MSPEVLCGQNHEYSADYFAVGVMGYEFMLGHRPYKGKTKQEYKNDILNRQVTILKKEKPDNWSFESIDFINKLIERKKGKRLGFNGINEIKQHQWFINFQWGELYFHRLNSPFIPNRTEKYFNAENAYKGYDINIDKLFKIIGSSQYEKAFKKFYYFNKENLNKKDQLKKFTNPHLLQYKI